MKVGFIMKLKKLLGKRIQELRTKNGLKQSELAEKVGIATKHQSCIFIPSKRKDIIIFIGGKAGIKQAKIIRQQNWLKIMQRYSVLMLQKC